MERPGCGRTTDSHDRRSPIAGRAMRPRRPSGCALRPATVRPVGEMIRFVAGPDGAVVPDLKRRLPGRGRLGHGPPRAWSRRRCRRRRLRARPARATSRPRPTSPDVLDGLLERSALDALSIAHKAGLVVMGFAKVEAALASGPVVALIRARDAGADGGRKLAAALRRRGDGRAATGKIVEAFTSAQLDLALGRLNVVHAALLAGRASETFLERWRILESFRADEPDDRDIGSRQPNDNVPEPGS